MKARGARAFPLHHDPEFRRLCSAVRYSHPDARSVLVMGSVGGEGTTSVALSLATVLAENQTWRVLLVDANVRAPMVHTAFDLEMAGGLRDWDGKGQPPYKKTAAAANLQVLTAGDSHDGESWVDQAQTLRSVAGRVKQEFDFIVWDSPPVTRYPDALELARLVDGVLLVVEADQTPVATLEFVRDEIALVKGNLLGAVMNRSGRFLPPRLRQATGK